MPADAISTQLQCLLDTAKDQLGQVTVLQVVTSLLACMLVCLALEQLAFARKRLKLNGKLLPGPPRHVPLLGGLVHMVCDPYGFWEQQRLFAPKGLSCNWLLGKFMIFTTDAELSRKALSINDEKTLLMAVHPAGKDILGENNLAFMHGPPHKAIRKSFLSLFTRKALSTYVELQDGIVRSHIAQWLTQTGEREIRNDVRCVGACWACDRSIHHGNREMNHETSLLVFVGPYLQDDAIRARVSEAFKAMTSAFLAFPLCLPGTAVWKGKQGRLYILSVLKVAAAESKRAMAAGGEPRCLMDFWAQNCNAEIKEAAEQGQAAGRHTTDEGMADSVMDFLFASQDASTASLVWSICLCADNPDVLAKVRAEQHRLRPDLDATIDGALLAEMTYTRQVVREVLRYRPPAPMVPQITQAPFPLGDGYVAPKGALIMPSLIAACQQGFTNPDSFDPDRFSPERKEDITYQRNFLTFGCGPHYCVGREYAINHLTVFLAILSTSCEWTRRRTDKSDTWLYLPTIYPADSFITLKSQ